MSILIHFLVIAFGMFFMILAAITSFEAVECDHPLIAFPAAIIFAAIGFFLLTLV